MTSQKFRGCRQSFFVAALLVALTFNLTAQAQDASDESAVALASTSVKFNHVEAPDISNVGVLSGDSEDDIWALPGDGSMSLHFDGNKWNSVLLARAGRMTGVAVLSPNDVWAVGQHPSGVHSEIQHFDGNKWKVVASPHFPFGETLHGVRAISPWDIFAVGSANIDKLRDQIPLVEHFDGMTWSVVPTPKLFTGALSDLAIISPTDIWTVGIFGGSLNNSPILTVHFDGKQWRQVPSPGSNAILSSVTAIATDDVWAAGFHLGVGPLIEHFDGKAWKSVPAPNLPNAALGTFLNSISAISATDIWAAGCSPECGDGGTGQGALIEHWDGKQWTINPAPRSLQIGDLAHSVLAFPSGEVFVAGISQVRTAPGIASFILHGKEGQ